MPALAVGIFFFGIFFFCPGDFARVMRDCGTRAAVRI